MSIVSPAAPAENPRIPARPTTYNGVRMRSRLEARAAAHLDLLRDAVWEYEPRCFAGPEGQYLPDFLLLVEGLDFPIYIEVKPAALVEDPFAVLERMAIIWRSEPAAQLTLQLWDDGGWVEHRLREGKYAYATSGGLTVRVPVGDLVAVRSLMTGGLA